jgi:hypothetical protein
MPYTAEQMDTFFQELALPGVWALVRENKSEAEHR